MSAEQHQIAALARDLKNIQRVVEEQHQDMLALYDVIKQYQVVLDDVANGKADAARAKAAIIAGNLTLMGTRAGKDAVSQIAR